MPSRRTVLPIIILTLALSGCNPQTPEWPTPELSVDQAVQTQISNLPAATATLEPTQTSPAAQPENTLTITTNPDPLPPGTLAGLLFGGPDLRQVQPDGSELVIYDKPVEVVSPDNQYTLVNSNGDFWLTTLATKQLARLNMTETRVECCAAWWVNHPDKILFLSNGLGGNNGIATNGYVTMVKQDGTGYRVLDSEHPTSGPPSVSPDGTWIAYGNGEVGWLFGGELGPQQVNPVDYGLVSIKGQTIAYPSWSPDGKYTVWAWQSHLNSGNKIGVLVLDMEQKTYRLGKLFSSSSQSTFNPIFRWSPDGNWLAYYVETSDPEESGTHLIQMDKTDLLDVLAAPKSILPGAWNKNSHQLALISTEAPNSGVLWLLDTEQWVLNRMGFEQAMASKIFAWQ